MHSMQPNNNNNNNNAHYDDDDDVITHGVIISTKDRALGPTQYPIDQIQIQDNTIKTWFNHHSYLNSGVLRNLT